jgi:phage-related protein (TIGR01555 family)
MARKRSTTQAKQAAALQAYLTDSPLAAEPAAVQHSIAEAMRALQLADDRYMLAGWGNTLTEVGMQYGADKAAHSRAFRQRIVPAAELEAIYADDALAQRIVDRQPDDCIREGFTLAGMPKMAQKRLRSIYKACQEYGILEALADGDKTARQYGGSLVIPITEGESASAGGIPVSETPFDLSKVTGLSGFEIVASPDAIPELRGQSTLAMAGTRALTNPEFYRIYGSRLVHRSRCIRFDGVKLPARMVRDTQGWSLSVLNAPYVHLRRLGIVQGYIEALVHSASLGILKISGLGRKLMGGAEEKAKARAAVRELQQAADNLHFLALDKEDSYDVSSRPLDGLNEVAKACFDAVVAAQDMPREVLAQTTPGGLNAGSQGPLEQYYGLCHARQERKYTPPLMRLLAIVFKLLGVGGGPRFSYTVEWNPLWLPSAKERAETRKLTAEADATWVAMRAAAPEQIGAGRVADGSLPAPDKDADGVPDAEDDTDDGAPAVVEPAADAA